MKTPLPISSPSPRYHLFHLSQPPHTIPPHQTLWFTSLPTPPSPRTSRVENCPSGCFFLVCSHAPRSIISPPADASRVPGCGFFSFSQPVPSWGENQWFFRKKNWSVSTTLGLSDFSYDTEGGVNSMMALLRV